MKLKSNKSPRERRSFNKSSSVKGQYFVDSLSAINEYLRFRPEVIIGIFASAKDLDGLRDEVLKQGLSSDIVRPLEGSQYSSTGAVVKLKEKKWDHFIRELDRPTNNLVVMLDHITDPRNLGAIARSCAFFGVQSIIVASNRQVLFSQASVATAMGGFALVDLVVVSSLASALGSMKDSDYQIWGADQNGEPISGQLSSDQRKVLVLGSEQSGLSKSVQGICDHFVKISGSDSSLESLNVSVAAGILLHSFAE